MTNKELCRQIKAALDDTGTALVLSRNKYEKCRARIFKRGMRTDFFNFYIQGSLLESASDEWERRKHTTYWYIAECCWDNRPLSLSEKVREMMDYQRFILGCDSCGWEVYGIDKKGKAWTYK